MLATSPAGPFGGAFFFCSGFALRPPLSGIAVSPRYFPDARLVTLRCPNFVRSCPLRGVSRQGNGGGRTLTAGRLRADQTCTLYDCFTNIVSQQQARVSKSRKAHHSRPLRNAEMLENIGLNG